MLRTILSLSLVGLSALSLTAQNKRPPNIVVILIDDMGYMDIGANNPDCFYRTPNIDGLAATGMRFTDGYAANPVCSPTRYSLQTGRYPSRIDATNYFSGRRKGRFRPAVLNSAMPLEDTTLAEALKGQGYRTAFAGKWHLGGTEDLWPEKQGYDVNIGGHNRGMPKSYFSPYKNPRLADGPKGEHLPERLVSESIRFIEASKDEPFFLCLAFYSVHTPLQAPKALTAEYRVRAKAIEGEEFGPEEQVLPNAKRARRVRILQKHAVYAAMVESMDTQIGRLLDKLEALGIDDETVVVFTSDNGGLSTSEGSPTSNLPLRGGKGWVYEGGIREPFLIRWPGVTKPGATCSVPVISNDLFPTLVAAAGGAPGDRHDGVDLKPLLKGETSIERDALYWHYPHYPNQGGFPGGAIRMGDYKLLERYEDGRVHLYDLGKDIGERDDLAAAQPKRVAAMRKQLHAWYRSVDAKFLRPLEGDGAKPAWRPGQ